MTVWKGTHNSGVLCGTWTTTITAAPAAGPAHTNLHSSKDFFHELIFPLGDIAWRCHSMHHFDHFYQRRCRLLEGLIPEKVQDPNHECKWNTSWKRAKSEAVRGILLITGGATSFSRIKDSLHNTSVPMTRSAGQLPCVLACVFHPATRVLRKRGKKRKKYIHPFSTDTRLLLVPQLK